MVLEEQSAQWAFERAAELTGLFERHHHVRRDVSIVVVDGKGNIAALLKALNHFGLKYIAMPDRDDGNAQAQADNALIEASAIAGSVYYIVPHLEGLIGYAPPRKDKPYRAITEIQNIQAGAGLPEHFIRAMNMVYLGIEVEAQPEVQPEAQAVPVP